MPITGHRVLTPELDADIRKAMQEWSIPRAVLLYMDEIPVEQHIHLDGKRLVRRTRRGKWTVKMYGPQERRASMEVADFFTAYAVRLCLKRAGKQWTMRVQEVLPEFRISNDSDKSAECTLADLASHRTGVRAWPGLDPDRNDIISVLSNLPSAKGFRAGRSYSAINMTVLKLVVESMDALWYHGPNNAGERSLDAPRTFEQFCKYEILEPLGLDATFSADATSTTGLFHISQKQAIVVEPSKSQGMWMTGTDMCKWLQTAPLMPGFKDMCKPYLEPSAEMREEWDRIGQSCMGVTVDLDGDAGVVALEGECPGFASGVYWLPNGHGTIGLMCNDDIGGVKLRDLIRGRVKETLSDLPKQDLFAGLHEQWLEAVKIKSAGQSRIVPDDAARLIGTWKHPSLGQLIIGQGDILTHLPALVKLPPSGLDKVLLAPNGSEGVLMGASYERAYVAGRSKWSSVRARTSSK